MEKLEWDSKFWNIPIYNIDENTDFNPQDLKDKQINNFLMQALIPEENTETINRLEDNGFRFVETKINLVKKDIRLTDLDKNHLREVCLFDIERHKKEFEGLYNKFSRFSIFDSKKVNDFYYKWIVNTIDGNMDDKCIGYFVEETLAGFITYKIRNNKLSIGLVGVFSQFQKRGIGQVLLNYINNIAIDNNCISIHVSTQGKNYPAINSYIKNGYIIENIQNWYYLRRDKRD